MMIVKIIGKIVAIPVIIMITVLLGVASAFEKIAVSLLELLTLLLFSEQLLRYL